uniref:PAP-associated domain-containing protein n=1 Tax=Globodera rostochiensis TaxID=31243 RepID=A0A914IFW3_GLORO
MQFLVLKNVSNLHDSSIASASSSSLNDVKRKYSAEIDQLSASITEFCSESFERNRKLNARIRPIVADMERVVCASGGHCRLMLIGSIASGMAFDASADLNLAIVYAGGTQKQREKFMRDFSAASDELTRVVMEAIADTLKKKKFDDANSSDDCMPRLASVLLVKRKPVVFGRFDDGLRFEIRFQRADFKTVRNTLMVRYYVQADRRFLLLFHWLRRVFQQMGLTTRQQNGMFSSYHTLLLVLHFLNRKEVPDNVLPAFVDFPAEMRDQMCAPDVANIVQQLDEPPPLGRLPFWTSKCAKSVGELAVELVDYYALFDPQTTAISIEHGRTDKIKQDANLKDRPFLYVYDPFHKEPATTSDLLGKALVLAFQFLRGQMTAGKHLATFPLLDGLAEEFAAHARKRGILWFKNLKQDGGEMLRDMKNVRFEQLPEEQGEREMKDVRFEQSSEEQGEREMKDVGSEQSSEEQGEREMKDGGFEQLPEEQGEREMKDVVFEQSSEEQGEREMKDGGFEQLPEEQGEREMKDVVFEQSSEEQGEREMKGGGFEQLLRNMRTKRRREMNVGFEQLSEEQGEREMKDVGFEQLSQEQGEREMKDVGFEQSSEEQSEMKDGGFEQLPEEQGEREMKGGGFEQLLRNMRTKRRREMNVGFEQSSEEQGEREMKDVGFEQLSEEQGEREMKDVGFEQSSEEQSEMKDGGFEQLPEEQREREMKGGGFEQLLRNMRTKRRREMKNVGFEQSSEEQGERGMKDVGYEQLSEEQGERGMKDVGYEQLSEEQGEREMKDVGFEQSSEEQEESEMKGGGFEQLLRNMRTKRRREMKNGGFEQSSEEQGGSGR